METYQSEIFKFFTEPKNFQSFVKLSGHYENVRIELLKIFWSAVANHLREKTRNSPWEVSLDPNIFGSVSKLQLYKRNWKFQSKQFMCVAWENLSSKPFRGLLLYMDNKSIDMHAVRASAVLLRPQDFKSDGSQWWAWWNFGNSDFTNPKGLSDILPDKCDQVAKEWAMELYELASAHEEQLDAIASKALST